MNGETRNVIGFLIVMLAGFLAYCVFSFMVMVLAWSPWWYTGILVVIGAVLILLVCDYLVVTTRIRHVNISARADQQHKWVLEDDPRGTYGSHYREIETVEWDLGGVFI